MRGSWMALIAVAACGDERGIDDGSGVRSGDRLRAQYVVAEGGAASFRGFHDRARDEGCSFDLRPGQTSARCLPRSAAVEGFLDAACTVPAFGFEALACDEPPGYVYAPSEACGGGAERIWRVGSLQRPTTVYTAADGGACMPSSPGSGRVWYGAVEEVTLDRFVRAELREGAGGARLRERYLEGADGSRFPIGAVDTALGVPCELRDSYGELACHPDVSEGGWLWADDACTVPIVERDVLRFPACAGAMAPFAAIWTDEGACGYRRSIVELSAPASTDGVHLGMEGACEAVTEGVGEVYAVGATLSPEELAAVERIEIGTGRLRASALVGDGARAGEWYRPFYDTERETPCTAALTQDGVTRCVPARGTERTYYADAQCGLSARVAVFSLECGASWPATAPVFVDHEPPAVSCGRGIAKAYEVATEREPGTLYEQTSGCTPVVWDRDEQRIYDIGPQIPSDRFVALDVVTE